MNATDKFLHRWYVACAWVMFALHLASSPPTAALFGFGNAPPSVRADSMATACFFMLCAIYYRRSSLPLDRETER